MADKRHTAIVQAHALDSWNGKRVTLINEAREGVWNTTYRDKSRVFHVDNLIMRKGA